MDWLTSYAGLPRGAVYSGTVDRVRFPFQLKFTSLCLFGHARANGRLNQKSKPPTLLPMTDGFHMSTETADEQVAKPNAVRYAYDADVQCISFDADGLPLTGNAGTSNTDVAPCSAEYAHLTGAGVEVDIEC